MFYSYLEFFSDNVRLWHSLTIPFGRVCALLKKNQTFVIFLDIDWLKIKKYIYNIIFCLRKKCNNKPITNLITNSKQVSITRNVYKDYLKSPKQ